MAVKGTHEQEFPDERTEEHGNRDETPARISDNALERRSKRWLAKGPYDCFVQVAPGLESVLAEELLDLGLTSGRNELSVARGGIGLVLDSAGIMRANLQLRTAGRVMLRLGSFPALNREMLYDRARKLAWEVQVGADGGYRLRVTSKNSKLLAGDEVTNTVASAISRHMREFGLYPKPTADAPLEFHVRLLDDRCTISLNTSGELLHRRGMRTHVSAAPLRETLAAAVAILGLGESQAAPDVIVDPFCGSGTLLIEVADLLAGLAPGRQRDFAFQNAAWFREGRWREARRQAEATSNRPGDAAGETPTVSATRLLGIDTDTKALEAARTNLAAAGHDIELIAGDSTTFGYQNLSAQRGLVISNLPYGVRLGDSREAATLTKSFLDRLAASGAGWRLALLVKDADPLTSHEAFEVDSTISTINGGVPVVLVTGRLRV